MHLAYFPGTLSIARSKLTSPPIALGPDMTLPSIEIGLDGESAWRPPKGANVPVFLKVSDDLVNEYGLLLVFVREGGSLRLVDLADGALSCHYNLVYFEPSPDPIAIPKGVVFDPGDDAVLFEERLRTFVERDLNPALSDPLHCRADVLATTPITCESGLPLERFRAVANALCAHFGAETAIVDTRVCVAFPNPSFGIPKVRTSDARTRSALSSYVAIHRPTGHYCDLVDVQIPSLRRSRWRALPQSIDVMAEMRISALELAAVLAEIEAHA